MSEPFYVYLAAPLTDLPAQYLANVATISRLSRELMLDGYIPINPAADLLEGLMGTDPLELDLYHSRSLALLGLLKDRKRAALYITGTHHADGRRSSGVEEEFVNAAAWNIPIVASRKGLDHLREAIG